MDVDLNIKFVDEITDFLPGGKKCKVVTIDKLIAYDVQLIIEFTNGKLVDFSTTDFGNISIAQTKEVTII